MDRLLTDEEICTIKVDCTTCGGCDEREVSTLQDTKTLKAVGERLANLYEQWDKEGAGTTCQSDLSDLVASLEKWIDQLKQGKMPE